ncbi:hypothetical protein BS50DRAFT_412352 [Corynespora cassiicola Philippines]|uniref:Heterokaryon incompatibility domain-containing protein n=1 Tax=Corynespora cassiicola Philippines TaxID=1448308 RepID=A0A2T2NLL0_CORCC|nr:hypothetical protein BS50DRAFT_412352 [Corynespora cassiicola Philippines]
MIPDWLIDITGIPAIVSTMAFDHREPYVVLSHDVKNPETDTLQSLIDFKKLPQPVPWKALPRVFQGAIQATLTIGIKYLWIAELCTGPLDLQDDIFMGRPEARYEAHKHVFLTLSALDDIIMDLKHEETRALLATVGNLCLRKAPRGFKKEIRASAVGMSAQCLQERLAATRTIHFGRDELYWECNALFAREGSNQEHTITSEDMCTVEEKFKATVIFDQDGDPIPNALKKWYQFVQRYSTLETKLDECSENPLLNIMGVIYSFNHVLGDIIVGHCEKDLHYGLLWYQNPTEDCKSYSKMPSWTWASRRGPISMLPSAEFMPYTRPDAIQAKAVDFFSVPGSLENVCSILLDAKLVLEGHSLHVRCDTIFSACRGDVRKSGWDHSVPVQIFENGGELIGTGYLDSVVEASPFSQAESVSQSAG